MKIYFAASLFNVREKHFNNLLVQELEKENYSVFLPQRDGYEFTSLYQRTKDMSEALNIIYNLDVAKVYWCDVLIAVLDEPIDEGVLFELFKAKELNKITVGIRTDSRTPFNIDTTKGLHYFVYKQLDYFLYYNYYSEINRELVDLLKSIS